jgi:hypothetical protein
MLRIASDQIVDSDLAYIAFRLAFFETLERLALAGQMGLSGEGSFGYLAEVPFLRHAAPQVQLDVLLDCWARLRDAEVQRATLVDESVIYASCETSARIVDADPQFATHFLSAGPRTPQVRIDGSLADALRFLHLNLPNDGDFLLVSQFQDVGPDEALPLKLKFGIDPGECEGLFDLLGRWHISHGFAERADGLLTPKELEQVTSVLDLARACLRTRTSG